MATKRQAIAALRRAHPAASFDFAGDCIPGEHDVNIDAPAGHVWSGNGLHCMAVNVQGGPRTAFWDAVIERIAEGGAAEPCTDPTCDYCAPTDAEPTGAEPTIVYSCPAYDVIEPTRDDQGRIALEHDMRFRCPDIHNLAFRAGSIRGYALANGEDPAAELARAERLGGAVNGHVPVWVSGTCVSLVSNDYERTRETCVAVRFGDLVTLEGETFTIAPDRNDNLQLVPVPPADPEPTDAEPTDDEPTDDEPTDDEPRDRDGGVIGADGVHAGDRYLHVGSDTVPAVAPHMSVTDVRAVRISEAEPYRYVAQCWRDAAARRLYVVPADTNGIIPADVDPRDFAWLPLNDDADLARTFPTRELIASVASFVGRWPAYQRECARYGFAETPLTADEWSQCAAARLPDTSIYGVGNDVHSGFDFALALRGNGCDCPRYVIPQYKGDTSSLTRLKTRAPDVSTKVSHVMVITREGRETPLYCSARPTDISTAAYNAADANRTPRETETDVTAQAMEYSDRLYKGDYIEMPASGVTVWLERLPTFAVVDRYSGMLWDVVDALDPLDAATRAHNAHADPHTHTLAESYPGTIEDTGYNVYALAEHERADAAQWTADDGERFSDRHVSAYVSVTRVSD